MAIKYMISADFGQTFDYTAVAVTERRLVPVGERYQHSYVEYDGPRSRGRKIHEVRHDVEQHYDLIRLDRVALRTPYTTIARGLVKLLNQLHAEHTKADDYSGDERVTVGLAIDEGGVGKAVRDILQKEIREGVEKGRPRVHLLPVTVHGGAATTIGDGWVHVPKRDLISAGLVAYQNGRLRVGDLRHRATLENELTNYRLKQNIATGHAAFEPLRSGQHDDLLFAVCLGVWAWEQGTKKEKYLRFPNQLLAH
ncbi:MAG: hypothetical protein CYG60_01020 [Actinobacteria bacterium]|nr:MAG: hypothetical protein CYG60_01020 [Actinomycetota bacterium]